LDKVIRAAFRVANISGQVANGEMSMEQAIKSEAAFHVMRNQALKLTLLAEPDSFSS
jgi:tellurite resistance protein